MAIENPESGAPLPSLAEFEEGFDHAIRRRRFRVAEKLAQEALHASFLGFNETAYSSIPFHMQMKSLAMPMYRRVSYDRRHKTAPIALEHDLSSVYGETTDLLEKLRAEYDYYHADVFATPDNATEVRYLRGRLSELTFFSLMSRDIYGDDDDEWNVIPADRQDDLGTVDPDGEHSGYDFRLLHRKSEQTILTQIKTSGQSLKRYRDNILVIPMLQIASDRDNLLDLATLQHSLINEVKAESSFGDDEAIASAREKLHFRLSNHLNQHDKSTR